MRLSFYDHTRMTYSEHVKLPNDLLGEWSIGNYDGKGGGVLEGGEFRITARRFKRIPDSQLIHLRIEAFGDGVGSLKVAIDQHNLLELVAREDFYELEAVSRALIQAGFRDLSNNPLKES